MRPLLKRRLGIDATARGVGLGVTAFSRPDPANHIAGLVETTVEEHCAEYGFYRIGENTFFISAAIVGFTLRETQFGTKPDRARNLGASLGPDQTVIAARDLAFLGFRMGLVQTLDNTQTKHSVAEKFQALVVLTFCIDAANAGVGQRLLK